MDNPYQPPAAPLEAPQPGVCPKCGSEEFRTPAWTWYGGAMGPSLLKHAVCNRCSFGFNYQTGRPIAPAIWRYRLVTWSVAIVVLVGYYLLR